MEEIRDIVRAVVAPGKAAGGSSILERLHKPSPSLSSSSSSSSSPPPSTILLTGPPGSGKSTILSLLKSAFLSFVPGLTTLTLDSLTTSHSTIGTALAEVASSLSPSSSPLLVIVDDLEAVLYDGQLLGEFYAGLESTSAIVICATGRFEEMERVKRGRGRFRWILELPPPRTARPAVAAAEAYMRSTLSSRADSHGVSHSLAVAASAVRIYDASVKPPEGASSGEAEVGEVGGRGIVEIAGLLHDVCDHKYDDNDSVAMEAFLVELLGESAARTVGTVIDYGSYSKQAKGKIDVESLEEGVRFLRDVVSDADKIEALGKVGVERCSAYQREMAASRNLSQTDSEIMADVRQHCDDKLLKLLPGYIYTKGGREAAERPHEEIVRWCEEYDERERRRGGEGEGGA